MPLQIFIVAYNVQSEVFFPLYSVKVSEAHFSMMKTFNVCTWH